MTLQQFIYIVAVDRYRNFVEAAKHCHVTQPTLSQQIQKLEDYLQVKIFDRGKQPVIPTPVGERIIAMARVVLNEASRVEEIAKDARGVLQGEYRLGIIPSVAGNLVPRFLPRFCQKYPDVNIIIDELQTEVLVEKLKDDQIDGGIAATPLGEHQIIEKSLYYESFYLYVHDSHPFKKRREIDQTELPGENILLMSEGHCFKNQALQVCGLRKKKSDARFTFESSNFQTLMGLVDQGLGITLLPRFVTDIITSKKKQERIKPFKGKTPVREISLIYKRSVLKEAILNAIYETILESVPAEMQSGNRKKEQVISPLA